MASSQSTIILALSLNRSYKRDSKGRFASGGGGGTGPGGKSTPDKGKEPNWQEKVEKATAASQKANKQSEGAEKLGTNTWHRIARDAHLAASKAHTEAAKSIPNSQANRILDHKVMSKVHKDKADYHEKKRVALSGSPGWGGGMGTGKKRY